LSQGREGFSLRIPRFLLAFIAAAGGLIGAGIEAARGGVPAKGRLLPTRLFRIPPMRSMRKDISFPFHPIKSSVFIP
jgi:hypothetical protein